MFVFLYQVSSDSDSATHGDREAGQTPWKEVREKENPTVLWLTIPRSRISVATAASRSSLTRNLSLNKRQRVAAFLYLGWEWPAPLFHIPLPCPILVLKDGGCSQERNEGVWGWKMWAKKWGRLELLRLRTSWSQVENYSPFKGMRLSIFSMSLSHIWEFPALSPSCLGHPSSSYLVVPLRCVIPGSIHNYRKW